jgi:hypothetical protein
MKIDVTRKNVVKTLVAILKWIFSIWVILSICMMGVVIDKTQINHVENKCPNVAPISDADKNWLVGLEYSFGFCEKLGLESSIIIQHDANGNVFGLPICIEAKRNE